MNLRKLKPVYVMHEEGVSTAHLAVVLEAIHEMLRIAGVDGQIKVHNFGAWRHTGWRNGDTITAWNSIDWYLAMAKQASTRSGQLHGGKLIELLYTEPWQDHSPHYDVVILNSDIYDDRTNFCIGLAIHGRCTVMSVNRFLGLPDQEQLECIKTEVLHEVGHVFGLVPQARKVDVEESLGKHCTRCCTMRQGLRVPSDWQNITQDRLRHGTFCDLCRRDLQRYFLS